jgi:hypothetical protein
MAIDFFINVSLLKISFNDGVFIYVTFNSIKLGIVSMIFKNLYWFDIFTPSRVILVKLFL